MMVLVAAAAVCAVVTAKVVFKPSDEELIKRVLVTAEEGVEKKEVSLFMSAFSKRYSDSLGFDYLRLKMYCVERFEEQGALSVTVTGLEVVVEGDEASVGMSITIEAREVGGGGQRTVFAGENMALAFAREGRAWRITAAQVELD